MERGQKQLAIVAAGAFEYGAQLGAAGVGAEYDERTGVFEPSGTDHGFRRSNGVVVRSCAAAKMR